MAQTRRRRRRKHRGTQGGRIDRTTRGRPRSRQEARARARSRQQERALTPPSWGSAVRKGLLASGIFFALLVAAFGRPVTASAALSLLMLAFYVPMGYLIDGFFYRRRTGQQQRQRQDQG